MHSDHIQSGTRTTFMFLYKTTIFFTVWECCCLREWNKITKGLLFNKLSIKQSESKKQTCKNWIHKGVLEEIVDVQPGLADQGKMVGIIANLFQGADLLWGVRRYWNDTLNREVLLMLKVNKRCLTPLCCVKVTISFAYALDKISLIWYHTTRSNMVFKLKMIKV